MTQTAKAKLNEIRTACGGKMQNPDNYPSSTFRGEQIYFCTLSCLRAFESNPEGFLAGEIDHPTDED